MSKKQMVLFSGGGWAFDKEGPTRGRVMDDYLIALTGKQKPKICLLGTATGDNLNVTANFADNFSDRCSITTAPLYKKLPYGMTLEERIMSSDLIYILGGWAQGCVASWRAAGIDATLHKAWEEGIVIAAYSAGAMALVSQYVTQWFRKPVIGEGLGFLPFSFTAHADDKNYSDTVDLYKHAVKDNLFVPGYCLDDGFVLRFENEELAECVRSTPDAKGYFFYNGDQDVDLLPNTLANNPILEDNEGSNILVGQELRSDYLRDRIKTDKEISWKKRLELLKKPLILKA